MRAADAAAVHALVRELAAFERAADQVTTTPGSLAEAAFPAEGAPVLHGLVAENAGGGIDGAALWSWGHSSWKGRVLLLDDLIVREPCRGRGLGRRLLAGLAARAAAEGVRELRWQVLDWNGGARRLYARIGAGEDAGWVNCRLHGEAFARLAGGD